MDCEVILYFLLLVVQRKWYLQIKLGLARYVNKYHMKFVNTFHGKLAVLVHLSIFSVIPEVPLKV